MQPQAFVTLTYPPHFLSTAVTIKSYFNHHLTLPVVVIIDDINLTQQMGPDGSHVAWLDYVDDCKQLYSSLGQPCRFVQLSTFEPIASGEVVDSVGWLRQQMVKFYMDQLLPDLEHWFFVDGDIFFLDQIPPDATPYSLVTKFTPDWIKYVSSVLKIDQSLVKHTPDDRVHTDDVTVSNPPWRFMSSKILQGLRKYVEDLHHADFVQLHADYVKNGTLLTWSEWELIELYQNCVLNQKNKMAFCPPMQFQQQPPEKCLPFTISMCNLSAEQDMGRAWFESQGVPVSDQHWQKICRIKK
jgi:hypothetical protein